MRPFFAMLIANYTRCRRIFRATSAAAFVLMLSGLMARAQTHAASVDATRATNLKALTGQLRIGAEYFLNPGDTKASIEQAFQQMHDTGLTIARIFIIWNDVERVPGVWDFHRYDWIYDAAARNGIKIAATLCPEDPPGWKNETPFYHSRINLNDPANRAAAGEYLQRVVGRYKDNPAQGIWLLMNEPAKYDTEPATFHAFGDWLETKYGTVDALNRQWFGQLHRFSDVKITDAQLEDYWTDYHAVIDWRNFNVDNLIDLLTWVKQQVEAIDPNHPTHFNVTRPIGDAVGQDVWKEKKVPDIIGVSMHWTMLSTTPETDYGERFAYRLDLASNASMSAPAKPFWVTELESGPVTYSGQFAFTETPDDLTRWIWDSYGAGSRAVVFWLWNPRSGGTEAGEWSLVSLDGTPSIRVAALKTVADILRKNPWLNQARPQLAKVAILYNRESEILMSLDGRRQHRDTEVSDSLRGCYLALHRAHVATQFVDLDQLKKGEIGNFKVLYIPESYALDDAAIEALKNYVRNGGTLWADGLTGWKTETGEIRPTIPGGTTDLFGVEATDVYPIQPDKPYSVTAQNEQGGELWRLPLRMEGAEVVLRDKDRNPFEMTHVFGKGRVYYFESAVSLAYKMRMNPSVQQWILKPSLDAEQSQEVFLQQGARTVLFRGMTYPRGLAAILSNWGGNQQVVVRFHGTYTLTDAMTGKVIPVIRRSGDTLATVQIPAGSVVLLKASRLGSPSIHP